MAQIISPLRMHSDTDSKYIAATRKAKNQGKTVGLIDDAKMVFFYCANGELPERGADRRTRVSIAAGW